MPVDTGKEQFEMRMGASEFHTNSAVPKNEIHGYHELGFDRECVRRVFIVRW